MLDRTKITVSAGMLIGAMVLVIVLFGGIRSEAQGAEYPNRPINIIVPMPAGGGTDVPTRLVSNYVAAKWGVPINIINKPGASGVTGTMEALSSKPDGYTLLGDGGSTSSLQVGVIKTPYDFKNRIYMARTLVFPMAYLVKADSEFKDLKEIAARVKKDPGTFVWGTASPSYAISLCLNQFFHVIGVDTEKTKKVIYASGPKIAAAIAGGHVMFGNFAVNSSLPFIQAGKVRAVGIAFYKRVKVLPEVLTVGEQGFTDITALAWVGISGPSGLPKEVILKWEDIIKKANNDPEFIRAAEKIGTVPSLLPSKDFSAAVIKEAEIASMFHKRSK